MKHMGEPTRIALVQAFFKAWDARDLNMMKAMLTPDFEYHTSSARALSADALFELMAQCIWLATPDEKVEFLSVTDDGVRVAIEARITSTHMGAFRFGGVELPATGRKIDILVAYFFTFAGDRIASWHEYGNLKEYVEQMGATVTITPGA
jgi:steroid delta-isomerase-like uncharacterized protein